MARIKLELKSIRKIERERRANDLANLTLAGQASQGGKDALDQINQTIRAASVEQETYY